MGEGCETRMRVFSIQRLSQWGRQRGGGFAAKKESQPRLAALGSPFQGKGLAWTLPPSNGKRCPEGAEVGWGKAGSPTQSLSQWGRLRNEDGAIPDTQPFPPGEGKEEAASPQKRKPTPPRCTRQPLPREGARVDTPFFQRKGGEYRFSHIVISSESEKSFSFAVRQRMLG